MYRIEFDLVAILLCVLTLIIFYQQKQVRNRRSQVFCVLLWTITGSATFSLLSSIALNTLPTGSVSSAVVYTTIYLLFQVTIPFLFCMYIFILCEMYISSRILRTLFVLPWFILLILIVLNVRFGLFFYINDDRMYVRGPAHLILYLISALYLVLVLHVLVRKQRKLLRLEVYAFVAAIFFPLVAVWIQITIPGLILECFAFSLVLLFLLLTIQNNLDFLDGITGLYNHSAFLMYLKDYFLRSNVFSLVLIRSRELQTLQTYLDNNTLNRLLHAISGWLLLLAGKKFLLFTIDDGLFAFVSARPTDREAVGELSLEIIKRSEIPWISGATRIAIPFQTAILHCPADCSHTAQVLDYIDQFITLTETYTDRHILYGKDFVPEKYLRQATVAYILQDTLDTKSLELLYQPVYSTARQRITAIEVLVALPLPGGERAYQSEVLHLAERTGLGQRLGELVLEKAFSWYVSNFLSSRGVTQIQIRLLESQCLETDWPRTVLRIAEKTGMDLSHLCLEITETSVVNTLSTLKLNMEFLLAKNVSFALDDYGSGYTDFGEILEMPFSIIKLDKKIVHAGLQTKKGERLLEGSVSLFRQIGWPIVAEGVETDEQAAFLAAMGCQYLQGYHFGYPVNGDVLLSMLS